MDQFYMYALVVIYFLAVAFLGYLGYRKTNDSSDYLIGGGKMNPVVMALSYGATFISASAIVGFGGVAATFGMGIQWLCFLNMFVGVVIAFIFFGRKTRQIGAKTKSSTFAEFLGNCYHSNKIRLFVAAMIFIWMPLYAAAVMRGGVFFMQEIFGISFNLALLVFTVVVAAYVIAGGMKGVMYTDAFQAIIMFVCMVFLIIWFYKEMNIGFTEANQALTNISDQIPESLKAQGHQGWTSMPLFGSSRWYTLVTSLIFGVGIGCLAQPQLVIRFMTVDSTKQLNRGVFVGCLFIFITVGVVYHVGALSNLFYMKTQGTIASNVMVGGRLIKSDEIIPHFINNAMPSWFSVLFMLCILSASMSTLSAQFHTMAAAAGYDIYGTLIGARKRERRKRTTVVIRLAVLVSIFISFVICYYFQGNASQIIALSTSIFMGICASAFLPSYFCALYWKKVTKQGAYASMWVGTVATIIGLLFFHAKEATAIGLSAKLFGSPVLISGDFALIDPIVYAFPLSCITIVLVSLAMPRKSKKLAAMAE
jgi:SSS family solute:Na+ symporter